VAFAVLIVEDTGSVRDFLDTHLNSVGYSTMQASSGEEGLALFRENRPDLVLLDVVLPGMDGIEFLRRAKEIDARCPIVVMTGYASTQSTVEAIKLGAEDYLVKPLNLEELGLVIERALARSISSPRRESTDLDLGNIIGESSSMQSVFEMVERVARARLATVLISGESGTGKEEVAKCIHSNSPSSKSPFVELNCSAIPENLLESELFGYEPGAFTDARIRKKGLLELAHGGTLFLDEIGLMGLDLQAKLLRVLETRSFRRLGGTEEITVDLRFIAATNQDLAEAVDAGRFREDLYYRLNVIPIYVPPLRERGDDVLLIARHYLDAYGREHSKSGQKLAPDAEALLSAYSWPGNVRELKNAIERVVLLVDHSLIHAYDLSIDRRTNPQKEDSSGAPARINAVGDIQVTFPPWGISLEEVEKTLIQQALHEKQGNVTEAAKLLHISRDTFRYRMKKYGLGGEDAAHS